MLYNSLFIAKLTKFNKVKVYQLAQNKSQKKVILKKGLMHRFDVQFDGYRLLDCFVANVWLNI